MKYKLLVGALFLCLLVQSMKAQPKIKIENWRYSELIQIEKLYKDSIALWRKSFTKYQQLEQVYTVKNKVYKQIEDTQAQLFYIMEETNGEEAKRTEQLRLLKQKLDNLHRLYISFEKEEWILDPEKSAKTFFEEADALLNQPYDEIEVTKLLSKLKILSNLSASRTSQKEKYIQFLEAYCEINYRFFKNIANLNEYGRMETKKEIMKMLINENSSLLDDYPYIKRGLYEKQRKLSDYSNPFQPSECIN